MQRRALSRACALALLVLCTAAYSQHAAPPPPTKETLSYGVEWRLIRAGTAKFTWAPLQVGWQGDIHLESAGLVTKLYRVNDDYKMQLDNNLCAGNIYIRSEEGKRKRETRVNFDHNRKKAFYVEKDLINTTAPVIQKEVDVPGCAHDIFGGLQKLRTLKLEAGQSTTLPISDGKKFAQVKIEAQEHEQITTPAGTFKTTRYEIFMFNNVLVNRNARCFVWLSDDARRVPVQIRVRMQFLIGTINLMLEKDEH